VGEQARLRDTGRDGMDSATVPVTESARILAFPDRSARLILDRHATGRGRLDGGWWPHSRDAQAQLPGLVTELSDRFGAVLRLAVDVSAWDEIPDRITVCGNVARVARYTDTNHVIVVTLGHDEHLKLLVVPPSAPDQAARAALAMSSRPGALGAQQILESCGIETEPVTGSSAHRTALAS
jgi:hypothetical protein